MLGNDVNFKVFSEDDDNNDDDWYDNFVTPLASNACVRVYGIFSKYDGNKWDFMRDWISLNAYTLYDWLCKCVRVGARVRACIR